MTTKAPPAGKFSYRQLANVARRDAEYRRRELPQHIIAGRFTIAEADDAIEAMQEIADILDWLADRELGLIGAACPAVTA